MSLQQALDFLVAVRDRPALLARYNRRNLAQLVFHAKNDGFEFTREHLADVVGRLEANVILEKDGDGFSGSSRLWRRMWGLPHLEYVVRHLLPRHSDDELQTLVAPGVEAPPS
jgi:hypothetical protein